MANDIGVKLAVEGENTFKSAIKAANAEIKALDAELKAVVSSFDDSNSAEEKAAAQMEVLSRQADAQKEKLEILSQQYDNAKSRLDELGEALEQAKAEHGENSAEAQKAANAYNRQAVEVANLERQMNQTTAAMNDTSKQMDELGNAVEDAGADMEDAGDETSRFADILKAELTSEAIIQGIKKLGQALKDLLEDTVEYGDTVDKMSQKMGMSSESYQEWDSVMRHCGTSMSALKSAMKTLSTAAENGNDAFERLGLSMDDVSKMGEEELFAAVISGLQDVENNTERTYLAGQLLGRGATELGALLNKSADEVQAMKDRTHELGIVMSDEDVKAAADFKDATQDLSDAWGGFVRNAVSNSIPALTELADLLSDIVAKANESGGMTSDRISGMIGMSGDEVRRLEELKEHSAEIAESLSGAAAANEKFMVKAWEATPALTEEDLAAQETAATLRALQDEATNAAHNSGDLREVYEELAEQLANLEGDLNEETLEMVKQQMAALELAATVQELTGSYPGFVSASEHAGVAVETLSQWLIDNGMTAEEWGNAVTGAVNNVINGFDLAETDLGMSLTEMASNLQANIEAYNNWNSNIQTLMNAAVDTGNQSAIDFVNYMIDLGVGAADQVAAMVQDVDGTMETFAPLFEDAADAGMTAVYNEITGQASTVSGAAGDAAQGAANAAGAVDFKSVGYQMDMGMVAGINSGASAVTSAAGAVAKAALNAAKANLAIQSPSRRFRDEVGKMITEGIAVGMVDKQALSKLEDSGDVVTESLKRMLGVTDDADELATVKAWRDAWEDALDDTLNSSKFSIFLAQKNNRGSAAVVKEYQKMMDEVHRQAEEARALGMTEEDSYLQKLSQLWWDYHDDMEDLQADIYDNAMGELEDFLDAYEDAWDDLTKKQASMQDKLSGYADLFSSDTHKYTGQTYVSLKNLDKQTEQLEKYAETMRSLRERGVSGGLMDEILSMSVDDASAYGKKLMQMSDQQWGAYMESWERNQDVAAAIADEFYRDDFEKMKSVGEEMAEALTDSFAMQEDAIAQGIYDAVMSGYQKAIDMATASRQSGVTADDLYGMIGGAVNGVNSAISGNRQPIYLVAQSQVDGRVIAESTFEYMVDYGDANGTPIVNKVTA